MQTSKQADLAQTRNQQLHNKRKDWLHEAQGFIALLFIWGTEWVFNAVIDFAIYWRDWDWLKQAAFITAVVASLIQIWGMRKLFGPREGAGDSKANEDSARSSSGWGHPFMLVLPGALLIAAVALLEAIGAVNPLFAPILRAFLLAIGFVQAGLLLGRSLIYLGLWLFVLTAIMGVWYLGYSGVILEGMGGISLLVSGYMLRVWGRASN
ncbi:hypothetical protein A8709_10465 [Paenibacillus pectinilyticus]|uniref:Uncharacterized protein n=1 Tax=Paenibacillus pectinilyticus TaxID=512399 RepID=A0A1C1A6A7_9BACL|nr:hypothetical protein [Paenibacillus pectinilyticus]OCT16031.1 hypothetical protein A8709_10465 [Paenibacillus pectinilyticus]